MSMYVYIIQVYMYTDIYYTYTYTYMNARIYIQQCNLFSNQCAFILKFPKYKKSDLFEKLNKSGVGAQRANSDTDQKFHISLAVQGRFWY